MITKKKEFYFTILLLFIACLAKGWQKGIFIFIQISCSFSIVVFLVYAYMIYYKRNKLFPKKEMTIWGLSMLVFSVLLMTVYRYNDKLYFLVWLASFSFLAICFLFFTSYRRR